MDAKKKRNRKKKGNQGKNTADVTSNAGEAALRHQNHESAPTDRHNGADADDSMSSVGEGVSQHQNHEMTPLIDGDGANAYDTTSSVGEAVACYQNNEPAMTQENHKVNSADHRSTGLSESSVELDIHKINDAKLGILESELEKLHTKVGYHSQNEAHLEEKINSLQNGHDLLVKKKTSLKERLNEMEETNKALWLQVKVLEEKSNSAAEENLSLVKSSNELDTRVQALEAKPAPGEVSTAQMVPEYKMMDQKDLTGPLLHQQTRGFTEGNNMIAEQGLDGSVTIISDNNYSQANNSPSNVYAGNCLEENSLQHMEKASIKSSTAEGLVDQNEHQFDRSRMSEEIMPVPLDDIQIHEDDAQQSVGDDEAAEVPFSDAPIIGAPFRMISFVARYVSGADLVGEK